MTQQDRSALVARLDAVEQRLAALAAGPTPAGRTDPAPGGEETWDAAQVWGHLSEFPGYWAASARRVLAAPPDQPASFGRGPSDAARLASIAAAEGIPIQELFGRCTSGIEQARQLIGELPAADWDRIGVHVIRGEIPVRQILESMIARHLEEHAQQLERLAEG